MITVGYRFIALCDWEDGSRCCTERARITGDAHGKRQFRGKCKAELKAKGWHFGKLTLCPVHARETTGERDE